MGPYALSLIIVSLMDQPVQMVEVFTFSQKRSVQLSQTSVPRRYLGLLLLRKAVGKPQFYLFKKN